MDYHLLQCSLPFAVMFAAFLPEAAIAALAPIDFFKSIVSKFLRRQGVGNGLSTESYEIRG